MYSRLINGLLILTLALGLWQVGTVGTFHAKAWLAGQLIERAWQQTLKGDAQVRPWPWADTWPVAELSVPRLGIRQIILSGDSGRVLAFGPGQTEHGAPGLNIISAHRDTYFRFLQDLQEGDVLLLNKAGRTDSFQVQELAIVDQRDFQIDTLGFDDGQHAGKSSLILVTCYPFDAIRAGGDQRFLVLALSSNSESSKTGMSSEMMLHRVSLSIPR